MPLDDELVLKAARQSDAAIIVIGRAAGEDREHTLEEGGYLLTPAERDMLDKVTKRFDKVILLINSGNPIDLSFINDYKDAISAVLYVWQGGMESGNAIADIISGKVSPSGKTLRHNRGKLWCLPFLSKLRRQGLQQLRRGYICGIQVF